MALSIDLQDAWKKQGEGMEEKKRAIKRIYEAFEKDIAQYRKEAACVKGCAYCCTDAKTIDMTTLEGLVIRDTLVAMPRSRKLSLNKSLSKDMKTRHEGDPSPCPFLMKNKQCMIYHSRPFSCRRIYSMHCCDVDHPPQIHRHAMALADQAIRDLQQLDDTGYSGHLSYILYMLNRPEFYTVYANGQYKPEEIMTFGKAYRITINRMVCSPE